MKGKDGTEYCDFCFISFGSAERRKYQEGKVYHLDCFDRMKRQKAKKKKKKGLNMRKNMRKR